MTWETSVFTEASWGGKVENGGRYSWGERWGLEPAMVCQPCLRLHILSKEKWGANESFDFFFF